MSADERPFYALLGVEVLSAEAGESLVRLPARPSLANSRGDVHGGAIATLLDAALAAATRSRLAPGAGATTITLTAAYLAPASGPLTASGRLLRLGRSIATVEATAKDQDGTPIAHALGTFRIIHRRDDTN
jgi:uncharacterized protein (TIGR00369 family)